MGNLSKFIEGMGSRNGPEIPTYPLAPPEPAKPENDGIPGPPDPVMVGEMIAWTSPLFGRLESEAVLEQGPDTFILRHPLTQEIVELPNEWFISMGERSAILEFDAGLPREEADKEARIEFFKLFRKGGQR